LIYDIERYKDFVLKKAGFISTLDLRDCRGEIPTLIRTSVFVPLEKLEDIICNDPKILLLCK
jgi:hypothetical protein